MVIEYIFCGIYSGLPKQKSLLTTKIIISLKEVILMGKIKKFINSIQRCYRSCKRRLRRYSMWDIILLKWSSIALGIIIGAYVFDFVKVNIGYWIMAVIILGVKPIYKFIKRF